MAGPTKTRRLGEVLVEEGIITSEQLQEALDRQKLSGKSLGSTLVALNFLTEDALYQFLAMQHGLQVIDVREIQVSPELLKLCSEEAARRLMVFPISQPRPGVLKIVASSPENPALLHLDYDLVVPSGTEFDIVLCPEDDLLDLINRHYKPTNSAGKGLEETLKELKDEQEDAMLKAMGGGDDVEIVKHIGEDDEKDDASLVGNEGPVIKMCNFILDDAVSKGASDIHINAWEKKIVLRLRIDGSLREMPAPPVKYKRALVSRFKIMARLDPMERRIPQDGRIRHKFRGRNVDLRISTLPSIWGENIVMRVIDQGSFKLDIKTMNFTPAQIGAFEYAYQAPYGMILVTGPTGSGKTTTLYAVLSAINDPSMNIMTAEDPVEYRLPHLIQVQVNPVVGLTFASVLKSFLRQDPDVIMVGEVRDRETADIGVKAALTGHLVISTLHTNDAPSTIVRLVDMGVDPMYVGTSVLVVCSQRLLRRVCKDCGESYTPSEEELADSGIDKSFLDGGQFRRGKGCVTCANTGYRGRVAVHEVVAINAAVRKAIFERVNLKDLKKICVANGMETMRHVALDNWKQGLTSLHEVLSETAPDR